MASTAPQTGYASVNGLQMYYEIHGAGRPLVVLHGAFMTGDARPRRLAAGHGPAVPRRTDAGGDVNDAAQAAPPAHAFFDSASLRKKGHADVPQYQVPGAFRATGH